MKTVLRLWVPLRIRKEDIRISENQENKAEPRKQGRWIKHALTCQGTVADIYRYHQ